MNSRNGRKRTPAQEVDRQVATLAKALAEREAIDGQIEETRYRLWKLAQRFGIPDGNSYRLRGRRLECSVSTRRDFVVDEEKVLALLYRVSPKTARLYIEKVISYRPTEHCRAILIGQARPESKSKAVKKFLRYGVTVTVSHPVRLEGEK